jgi:hypothetical protein
VIPAFPLQLGPDLPRADTSKFGACTRALSPLSLFSRTLWLHGGRTSLRSMRW